MARNAIKLSRAIRLHLFLVFAWLATIGPLLYFVAPSITPESLSLAVLIYLLFPAIWAASLLWRHRRSQAHPETPQFAMQFNLGAMWGENIATVAIGFIILPQLSDFWQPVASFYVSGTIAIEFLATIRPPPTKGRASLAPLFLSGSIIGYLAFQGGPVAIALIIYHAAFAYIMWVLRKILQKQSDKLHIALTQVETQRDAKTRFLASASHDLGQPLQAARMFFDQAMRSEPGAKRDKAVRGVHWAFDASEQLLGQMMAHLQLESGAVEARMETLVVGPLIAEVADMNEPAAGLAGVSIHAMPCRLKVRADAALFQRALGNLLGNAIRHARAKRILIGVRWHGGNVRVWVIDDGVGILPADLPRLFDDYVQGSDHGQEIRGGFGLGLATTLRLARLMGGDAGYEAKWVKGSAFWLELRAA
jgi:signal transduction histidine kinase